MQNAYSYSYGLHALIFTFVNVYEKPRLLYDDIGDNDDNDGDYYGGC